MVNDFGVTIALRFFHQQAMKMYQQNFNCGSFLNTSIVRQRLKFKLNIALLENDIIKYLVLFHIG